MGLWVSSDVWCSDLDGGDRRCAEDRQREGNRAPRAAMHEISEEDSGRNAQERRSAFRAGFQQAPAGVVRFAVHELNLTHTLPRKNKKFIT